MWIYTNANRAQAQKNAWRYKRDGFLDDVDFEKNRTYKPKRCINYEKKHCAIKDPVSNVYIPLIQLSDSSYICANCKTKEQIDRWFINLQRTEIPTTLPQFHKLKGRLIPLKEEIWDFGPPSNDPCWRFYNIIGAY